jgi:DNA-binding NtrC family response regulator
MAGPPVVWIVAEEQWMRALLRGELIERGFDAVGFLSVHDAMEQLAARYPAVVVMQVSGQPASHLEQLLKIGVPVIATGGTVELATASASSPPLAAVLPRPVTIGAIADRVAALAQP